MFNIKNGYIMKFDMYKALENLNQEKPYGLSKVEFEKEEKFNRFIESVEETIHNVDSSLLKFKLRIIQKTNYNNESIKLYEDYNKKIILTLDNNRNLKQVFFLDENLNLRKDQLIYIEQNINNNEIKYFTKSNDVLTEIKDNGFLKEYTKYYKLGTKNLITSFYSMSNQYNDIENFKIKIHDTSNNESFNLEKHYVKNTKSEWVSAIEGESRQFVKLLINNDEVMVSQDFKLSVMRNEKIEIASNGMTLVKRSKENDQFDFVNHKSERNTLKESDLKEIIEIIDLTEDVNSKKLLSLYNKQEELKKILEMFFVYESDQKTIDFSLKLYDNLKDKKNKNLNLGINKNV